jgi:hypothetical protein
VSRAKWIPKFPMRAMTFGLPHDWVKNRIKNKKGQQSQPHRKISIPYTQVSKSDRFVDSRIFVSFKVLRGSR